MKYEYVLRRYIVGKSENMAVEVDDGWEPIMMTGPESAFESIVVVLFRREMK